MKENVRTVICSLFYFDIQPRVLVGNYTHEEALHYFREAGDKIKQGFNLSENVCIRRFTREDFEKIKEWCRGSLSEFLVGLDQVKFVIEFSNLPESDDLIVEKIIQNFLLATRIHKAVPVTCKFFWSVDDSRIKSLGVFYQNGGYPKPPAVSSRAISHVHLFVEDIDVIKELFDKIQNVDFVKRRSFQIACERFTRSFEEPNDDEILIDYCIAFEALFFKGEGSPPSVGKYVGLACSLLLGKNEQERDEIHTFIVKAYEIRNKIVHGSEFKTPIKLKNGEYELNQFILHIQCYLKESLKRLI